MLISTIMKRKLFFGLALVLVAALFCYGCSRSDKSVLANVDEKDTITLGEFNDRITKLPQRYQDVINKNKKAFLDELITDVLLHNEARRKKLYNDKDVQAVIEEAKKKIMIARLLKDEVEDNIVVTESEVKSHYDLNRARFMVPEVLRASHILVNSEGEAREIRKELSGGGNFEDLARARSIDPTSASGGDIGYFAKGQFVPELEEACFKMEPGEISGIVKTQFGYHIIKVTERRPPGLKALNEVRGIVEQSLKRQKQKVLFNEYVARLKEKAKITINNDLLESIREEIPEESSKN